MNLDNAVELLKNVLHHDNNIRDNASETLRELSVQSYPIFLQTFIPITVNNSLSIVVRNTAVIMLRDLLYSDNRANQKFIESQWYQCPEEIRSYARSFFEENLNWKELNIQYNFSNILGSIARIDFAYNINTDFFTRMGVLLQNPEYAKGVLEAVAFVSDKLYNETNYDLDPLAIIIYNISTYYLTQEVAIPEPIILASLRCTYCSVDVFFPILDQQGAKNAFLLSLFKCDDYGKEALVQALSIIVRIVGDYSKLLSVEIAGISKYVSRYFSVDDPEVRLEVFEFYTIIVDLGDKSTLERDLDLILQHSYQSLTQEYETDEWTAHKAATSLLKDMTNVFRGVVLSNPISQNFIKEKLSQSDSSNIAIAALALGSVCEKGYADFLESALQVLISQIDNEDCQKEVLFGIARICEVDSECADNFLEQIYSKVIFLITSKSENIESAFWALNSIFLGIKKRVVKPKPNFIIFANYEELIKFIKICFDEYSLDIIMRQPVHSAFCSAISICPPRHTPIIIHLLDNLYEFITLYINHFFTENYERMVEREDILSDAVLLVEKTISKIPDFDVRKFVKIISEIMGFESISTRGEIYIILSKHLELFSPVFDECIELALKDLKTRDVFVAKTASNFLSDVANTMGKDFISYLDNVVNKTLEATYSDRTAGNAKSHIITSFGDIAVAVGVFFEPYFEKVLGLCSSINSLERKDHEDYVDDLRRGMLVLLDSLIVAIGSTSITDEKLPHIIELLTRSIEQDDDYLYMDESLTLIEDISKLFQFPLWNEKWCQSFFERYVEFEPTVTDRIRRLQSGL